MEKKIIALRYDAPGWLRCSARFHGIKDSALNPRDCGEARVAAEGSATEKEKE